MGKTWIMTAGSGGIGKSSLTIAFAVIAARQGKTLILDACGPCRACDLYMGMQNVVTLDLRDVLLHQIDLTSVIYPVPEHENLFYACVSLFRESRLEEVQGILLSLQEMFENVFLDISSSGMNWSLPVFTRRDRAVVLLRPDHVSFRGAEAIVTDARNRGVPAYPVINQMEKSLVRHGYQMNGTTVSQVLDCPVAGEIMRMPDFFTSSIREEHFPVIPTKQMKLFEEIYHEIDSN
ncbi:MAG: hypothetical protein IJ719_18375 [Clostridia bacterium]|nr:hypothetical protein [Clostridia bacterium]